MFRDHYVTSVGDTLDLFPPGKHGDLYRLMKRHPYNNRDEDVLVEEYEEGILEGGYSALNRSCTYYKKVAPTDLALWMAAEPRSDEAFKFLDAGGSGPVWLLGGATCAEAAYSAIAKQPQNTNCLGLLAMGFENCVQVLHDATKDVLEYVVKSANKHCGSGCSAKQLLDACVEYDKSWADKMESENWSYRTFGKGRFSHNAMQWEHVEATYGDVPFRNVTQYNRCHSLIYQLEQLGAMEDFHGLVKKRMHARHKKYDLNAWLTCSFFIENGVRNSGKLVAKAVRAKILISALGMCIANKPKSDTSMTTVPFVWSSEDHVKEINSLFGFKCRFAHRKLSGAQKVQEEPKKEPEESEPSKKKPKRKAGGGRKSKKENNDADVELIASVRPASAAEDEIVSISFVSVIGHVIGEGVQLLQTYSLSMTAELWERIVDVINAFFIFALTGTAQVRKPIR